MATSQTADRNSAAPARPRAPAFVDRRGFRRVLPWIVIVAIFVIWELVVRVFDIEQFVLPAPSAVFASGWEWRWPILENAWQTFMTTAIGFFFAVIFGLVTGIATAASPSIANVRDVSVKAFITILPVLAVRPVVAASARHELYTRLPAS